MIETKYHVFKNYGLEYKTDSIITRESIKNRFNVLYSNDVEEVFFYYDNFVEACKIYLKQLPLVLRKLVCDFAFKSEIKSEIDYKVLFDIILNKGVLFLFQSYQIGTPLIYPLNKPCSYIIILPDDVYKTDDIYRKYENAEYYNFRYIDLNTFARKRKLGKGSVNKLFPKFQDNFKNLDSTSHIKIDNNLMFNIFKIKNPIQNEEICVLTDKKKKMLIPIYQYFDKVIDKHSLTFPLKLTNVLKNYDQSRLLSRVNYIMPIKEREFLILLSLVQKGNKKATHFYLDSVHIFYNFNPSLSKSRGHSILSPVYIIFVIWIIILFYFYW